MLQQTYHKIIKEIKETQPDAIFLFVARYKPRGMTTEIFDRLYSEWCKNLAPSQELHKETYTAKNEIMKILKISDMDAHNKAFIQVNYRNRFLKEMKNPKSIADMQRIKEVAKEKDVFLVCYEPEGYSCHRHLLIEIINTLA